MDIQSLYYFKELAEDLNMTKTAERLYISQQTLSNHIQRLEKYYNVKLFERNHNLTLTTAGVFLKNFAEDFLKEDKQIKDIFYDIKKEDTGFLRLGASPMRSFFTFPHIFPKFSAKFPNVSLTVTSENSQILLQRILNNDLDLALCLMNESIPNIEADLLLNEQIYLCISEKLFDKYYPKEKDTLKEQARNGLHVRDFKKLPFFIMPLTSKLGISISNCFQEAGFKPITYLEAKYVQLSYSVCAAGLAACFMSSMQLTVALRHMNEEINIFPVLYNDLPLHHKLFLIHNTKQYSPKYAQYFSSLIKNFYHDIDMSDLNHLV